MLGSSLESARSAARRGLGYASAAYTDPEIAHKVRTDADVVGGPERAGEQLAVHVERSGADEIIATTNVFALEDRLACLERFARVMGVSDRLPARSAA